MRFVLIDYFQKNWVGEYHADNHDPIKKELSPVIFHNGHDTVTIGVRQAREEGTLFVTIYSPFWMLNKTGLNLTYKSPVREHPPNYVQPLLYSSSDSDVAKRHKASLKVGLENDDDSEWSTKFSPDTVGSNGVLVCERTGVDSVYEIGMQIKPTSSVLTKMCVFTPYYVLSNLMEDVAFEIREDHDTAEWIRIEPKQTVAFYPLFNPYKGSQKEKEKDQQEQSSGKDLEKMTQEERQTMEAKKSFSRARIMCRMAGSTQTSPPFAYDVLQSSLLRVSGRAGGIYVGK